MAGLRKVDATAQLATVPLFEGLSKKALQQIASMSKERHFRPGDEVTVESTRGARFHLILEGTAAVKKRGREVAKLGPGDTVGEMALIDEGPRTATVVALEPLRTLTLASWNFRALLRAEPTIMEKLLVRLVGRLREADRVPVA